MLKEIKTVKQQAGEGLRRWFSDDFFDLIVWLDDAGELIGIQLCYDLLGDERALSWHRARGFSHDRIDTGEQLPHRNMSPVLVADGVFGRDEIADEFAARSVEIDPEIRRLVSEKLEQY
jgi:hypothetical protein